MKFARKGISPAFILVVLVLTLGTVGGVSYILGTWGNVDTGYASVVYNSYDGTIGSGPTGPYSHPFVVPYFYGRLVPIYIAVSSVHMCTGYDPTTVTENNQLGAGCDVNSPIAVTRDQIKLAIDVNVFWTINAQSDKLINLYRNYPQLDYASRVIVPIVREAVRDVAVNRTFDQVFEERANLPAFIASEVTSKVSAQPTLQGIININPTAVQVLQIHMPQQIADSLQAKKASEIAILTASNVRNATIINADASRQQAILQARGQATAKLISANATRDAILAVLQSIGCPSTNSTCQQQAATLYLTLLQLQQIAASSPNTIFIIGQAGNGQFFLLPLNSNSLSTTTSTTTTTTTT